MTAAEPRDDQMYPGLDPSQWGPWIKLRGRRRPVFVRTSLDAGGGDPVTYVGRGVRGVGRNWSPPWSSINWFRLPLNHAYYSGVQPTTGDDRDNLIADLRERVAYLEPLAQATMDRRAANAARMSERRKSK